MLHSKVLTIDDEVVMVGSSTFNRRSLDHDEAVAITPCGGSAVDDLVSHVADDCRAAEPLSEREWRARSTRRRLAEAAVAPLQRYR